MLGAVRNGSNDDKEQNVLSRIVKMGLNPDCSIAYLFEEDKK